MRFITCSSSGAVARSTPAISAPMVGVMGRTITSAAVSVTPEKFRVHDVTEFGVVIPANGEWGDKGAILDGIHAAEDLGLHTCWFGDHVVIPGYAAHLSEPRWFDSVSCMLVGAGATSRIRFGTDVLVLPYRNPVVLSRVLASGDQL